jgi:hypothetical protein
VIPSILFVSVFFIPEVRTSSIFPLSHVLTMCSKSPRWFLVRDRPEDAIKSLRAYRKGRFTEDQIMEEFAAQQAMTRITTEKGGFKEMWQGTNLKRSLIVIGANFCIQITGQGKFSGMSFHILALTTSSQHSQASTALSFSSKWAQ